MEMIPSVSLMWRQLEISYMTEGRNKNEALYPASSHYSQRLPHKGTVTQGTSLCHMLMSITIAGKEH
jgi:hypothetical protein